VNIRIIKHFITAIAVVFLGLSSLSNQLFAEKVLNFGVMGPFTGPSAKTGMQFKGSTTLIMEKINYKIGDYTLKPIWIDSQSDPAKATAAYAEAAERYEIQAGALNWHSSVAVAVMEVAAQYKVPHLMAMGAATTVNKKWHSDSKYNYWGMKGWPVPGILVPSYVEAVNQAIKDGVFKPKNGKKVAILVEDTDWGHSSGEAITKKFEETGWTVVFKDYFSFTQQDFYPVLGKIKKLGADVFFSTTTATAPTVALVKQIDEIELGAITIIDGFSWSGDWYKMTGAASNRVLDMAPKMVSKKYIDWSANFEKRFDLKPSSSAGGLSYDGVGFLVKLLQRTYDKYGELNKKLIHKVMIEEVNTGKLAYTAADGALIMKSYTTNADVLPDPKGGTDAFFFPVVQYKNGKEFIVYPPESAERSLEVR
jgi:branched-chain amino acid transport system substrate-binding protein